MQNHDVTATFNIKNIRIWSIQFLSVLHIIFTMTKLYFPIRRSSTGESYLYTASDLREVKNKNSHNMQIALRLQLLKQEDVTRVYCSAMYTDHT